MGFPGRENVPTPRGSILRPTTGPQRPYKAKIKLILVFFGITPIGTPLTRIGPLKGPVLGTEYLVQGTHHWVPYVR